jgi:hypothetical protein
MLRLGSEIQVSSQLKPSFDVLLEFDLRLTRGWLTKLTTAEETNKLNVFYFRNYQKPTGLVEGTRGTKTYQLEDGVYEAEFAGPIVHRVAFQVKDGGLVWIQSVTLSKKQALEKIAEALTPSKAR